MIIETTINAQTKNYLKEAHLAKLIKNMEFSDEYMAQIFNLFTDVHTQDIAKFMIAYDISYKNLKMYYEKYIKKIYPNAILEEMLSYG